MKVYYYEYETSVFSQWEDCKYYWYSGFLIESPIGLIEVDEDDSVVNYESLGEFKFEVNKYLPKNFNIVELEA